MRYVCLLLLFCLGSKGFSQPLDWVISAQQEDSSSYLTSTVLDQAGNTIVAGKFIETIDFDPGPDEFILTPVGLADIYLWKVSANGEFIWAKQIGGTLNQTVEDIAIDFEDNVYITGCLEGIADFDPGAGILNLTSSGNGDIYSAKYNVEGELIWAQGTGSNYLECGRGITVDSQGYVYVVGEFSDETIDFDSGSGVGLVATPGSFLDTFIQKLAPDGSFVWVKSFQDSGEFGIVEFPHFVNVDVDDNIIINGVFAGGTVDFDPGSGTFNLTAIGNLASTYVVKLDNSGSFLWARQLDPVITFKPNAFDSDINGNLYFGGYFDATADFDPGINLHQLTNAGFHDMFVMKWNSGGELLWIKSAGTNDPESVNSLNVDTSGNIFLTGVFQETCDFDFDEGLHELTPVGSYNNIFVMKLNNQGHFSWVDSFGGQVSNSESYSIHADNESNVVISGIISGPVDFDNSDQVETFISPGDKDEVFILKLFPCVSLSSAGAIAGPPNACPQSTVTYSVSEDSNAEGYVWTLPSGWIGNSTSNEIEVAVGEGVGNIQVMAYNGCGNSSSSFISTTVTAINTNINSVENTLNVAQSGAAYQWIDCNNNDQPISGATSQSFSPISNGNYGVVITLAGCTLKSLCFNVTTIEVDDQDMNDTVSIYPAPAVTNFFVTSTAPIRSLDIYDAYGRLVQRFDAIHKLSYEMNIISLQSGVYSLLILDDNGRYSSRVFLKVDQ